MFRALSYETVCLLGSGFVSKLVDPYESRKTMYEMDDLDP